MDNFIFILLVSILLFVILILIYAFLKYTGISLKATFDEIRSNFKPDLKNTLRDLFLGGVLPVLLLPLYFIFILIAGFFILMHYLFFVYKPFESLKYSILTEMNDPKYFFRKNFC